MQDEFEMLPDDEQVEMMNREFKELGVGGERVETHYFEYPIPVYMTDHCIDFCGCCDMTTQIISTLDSNFLARNKKTFDFILASTRKNRIAVAKYAGITQNLAVRVDRMPIKQSMYRLLSLHNSMSICLSELNVYVKSAEMQEVILRHLIIGSIIHGVCI